MSRPDLSVVAPCLNEEENVARLAGRLAATFERMGLSGEAVLVDDGSGDRTWERIEELQARPGSRVQGVRHDSNRGIEAAWASGLRAARAPLACLIDADLQNRPEDVAVLHARWQEAGADLVQAVRQPTGVDRYRLVYSRTLNALLNVTFGMRLRDSKSGFVLGPREVLASLLEHRWRYRYYQVFLGVAAGVRGLAIAEVETPFEPRSAGKSFLAGFPLVPILRILAEVAKYRCETWMFRPERAAGRVQGSAS